MTLEKALGNETVRGSLESIKTSFDSDINCVYTII